jgi:2-dehydro-3-deoxyphosphooctonate aldolase (KDO 8-P synthase)
MNTFNVSIGNIILGNSLPFVLIAGPDSIESKKHALMMASNISSICRELKIPYIFKASYDKANRTSVSSFRGVGVDEGLKILKTIKDKLNIPVTTDVHTEQQAAKVGEVVDLVQVPALLSRQTDLLIAAGKTGKAVNVKKGQFIAPQNVNGIIEKIRLTNNDQILITERGYSFGYNDVVADMRSLEIMKRFGFPVIFDAAHTVQFPSGGGDRSSGDRKLIPTLARASIAVGIAGIFIEVHNDPENAACDGANSLNLSDLKNLLITLKKIDQIVKHK